MLQVVRLILTNNSRLFVSRGVTVLLKFKLNFLRKKKMSKEVDREREREKKIKKKSDRDNKYT